MGAPFMSHFYCQICIGNYVEKETIDFKFMSIYQ